MFTVERIEIEWDEDGPRLIIIHTEEETPIGFRLSDPEQAYDAIKGGIGPWLRERDEAQFERYVGRVFACDPDESGGYDVSDPKHPDFHSVHAVWDAREGK